MTSMRKQKHLCYLDEAIKTMLNSTARVKFKLYPKAVKVICMKINLQGSTTAGVAQF